MAQQTVKILNVPGRNVVLGANGTTQAASVMEIAFVSQNKDFDFLLNIEGGIASVNPGEVGVPVYFMQANDLQVGDTALVDVGGEQLALTVTCFVRDAQMNPSIVTSKRFLVSENDWQAIGQTVGTSEYLIEFLLEDASDAGVFEQQYATSGLPQSDTAITYSLFQLLSALSDGLVAAVVILIGLLLVLVALLCLRYTILGALEEDTREIGVMKAIGLSVRDTLGLYRVKYTALAAVACAFGYVLSIPLQCVLTGNITLYMGSAPQTLSIYLLPFLAVVLVFLLIVLIVRLVLRRLGRLSAVKALQAGTTQDIPSGKRRLSFRRSRLRTVNLLLALQDMWLHGKCYCRLAFIFTVCTFLAITPVNLYSTVSSSDFISYMGAGSSDLLIDLQTGSNLVQRGQEIEAYLGGETRT